MKLMKVWILWEEARGGHPWIRHYIAHHAKEAWYETVTVCIISPESAGVEFGCSLWNSHLLVESRLNKKAFQ